MIRRHGFRSLLSPVPLPLVLALFLIPAATACNRDNDAEVDVVVDVAMVEPREFSGRYDVSGSTQTPGTQDRRRIEGSIIIVQVDDAYSATYDLTTTWPTEAGSTDADVVGVGEGSVAGDTLTGEARTQLVISSVPGVDVGFAFVPRMVTTRVVSNSVATIGPDFSIEIEIENRGAEGEAYASTRTRLIGQRVDTAAAVSVEVEATN